MTEYSISFTIAGLPAPVTDFSIQSGSYGSVGHADIGTSITALRAANIDLTGLSIDLPAGIEIGLWLTADGVKTKIFGGEYVKGEWDYDADEVKIFCRDFAGVLVDQKRILSQTEGEAQTITVPGENPTSGGVSTQNQTLQNIVTQIAKQFSLTPVFNLDPGSNIDIGTIYGTNEAGGTADTVFMTTPQSLWATLNQLARDTGNEVYVTPSKELVFGIPGAGAPQIVGSYKMNPVPSGAVALRDLRIVHNVRRNSSFRVQVISYNPSVPQIVLGEAYVVGTNLSTNGQVQIKPGLWSGSDIDTINSSVGSNSKQIPLYSFHIDGLTQAQADARAMAIAADIAKREFVVSASPDIIPGIIPMNQIRLVGALDQNFLGQTYYAQSFRHSFGMPTKRGKRAGLVTYFMALDIQVSGEGGPILKSAPNK